MFSMLPIPPPPTYNQGLHLSSHVPSSQSSSPLRSSPLSARNGNVPACFNPIMSPTPPAKSSRDSSFSRRTTKANPLIHNHGDSRETRRKLFLKKVREDSEDRRWAARGGDDEMMRTIWIAEQRRRAEQHARDAMLVPDLMEELHDTDIMSSTTAQSLDQAMVEDVAQKEEEEIEALLSLLNETETKHHTPSLQRDVPRTNASYGSDEDDYDHLLMDLIQEESRVAGIQPPGDAEIDHQMMDMS